MMRLSSDFKDRLANGIKTCWTSPSNIALIKYWGKKGHQLPANPSLSFSLNEAFTVTRIHAGLKPEGDGPEVLFTFEGEKNEAFAAKIASFLSGLNAHFPFLPFVRLIIESGNNFPHSAGIASSASSMSALALSLMSIEQQLSENRLDELSFKQKASYIARLGSGSACRSVYGGYTVWGKHPDFDNSSDEYAVPAAFTPGSLFENIKDTILLVDPTPKKVSSSAGHHLMNDHPYASARYTQAVTNLSLLKKSIIENDWERFAFITENEALSLHAMMMCSNPGYILMHPNTISLVQLIWEIRKQNHMNLCFTLDAGPNIHLLYPEEETEKLDTVVEELKKYCYRGNLIHDKIGKGPENKYCK